MGSNIDPENHLASAIRQIQHRWPSAAISGIYRSAPQHEPNQPDFLNAVCKIETQDTALAVVATLRMIEEREGKRKSTRYGPRTIDLDLLLHGEDILPSREEWQRASMQKNDAITELFVPHLRMDERAFVIVPLSDLAPSFVHPVTKETIGDLLRKTSRQPCVRVSDDTLRSVATGE